MEFGVRSHTNFSNAIIVAYGIKKSQKKKHKEERRPTASLLMGHVHYKNAVPPVALLPRLLSSLDISRNGRYLRTSCSTCLYHQQHPAIATGLSGDAVQSIMRRIYLIYQDATPLLSILMTNSIPRQ